MLSVFFLLAFVSTGGVVGSVFFKKRYEETAIISVSVIVLLLFVFGIFKQLKAGLIIECIICALCYLASLIYLIKKKEFKSFSHCFFTPGFAFLAFTTILLSILLSGRYFEEWDEFSHWGDVVKAMVTINDFSTSPLSQSQFQSYPPAMAILQYCTEKFNSTLTGAQFVEWITYPSYFVFVASFILPCFRYFDKFNLRSLLFSLSLFLFPLIFYVNFYSCLYIDPALGILLFIGLYLLFTYKADDKLFVPHIACVCSILPITKDAGLLFSVFIGLAALVLVYLSKIKKQNKEVKKNKNVKSIKHLVPGLAILGSVVLPKVLWNYSIESNHAVKSFPGKVDFVVLLNVLLRRDTSYKREVLHNYVIEFFSNGVGNNGIRVTYFVLLLALMLGLFYFSKRQFSVIKAEKHSRVIGIAATIVISAIYLFGICVMYMFKFSQYEAVKLASYNRYINILFLGLGYLLTVMLMNSLSKTDYKKSVAVFCVILIFSPWNYLSRLFSRKLVVESRQYRRQYISVTASVDNIPADGGKVYILSQEDNGADYEKIKYLIRPLTTYAGWQWSIGEAPYYADDIYTKVVEPDAWIDDLFDEYSYLIVYKNNKWFTDTYSDYFVEEIRERQIYRVDTASGMLVPVLVNGADYIDSLCDQDYTVFISIKSDGPVDLSPELETSLRNLGVDYDSYSGTGYYNYISILNNGSMVEETGSEQRIERTGSFDFGHEYKIQQEGVDGCIIIDRLDYSTNKPGINIVVYDNKQNDVVDTVNIDIYSDAQVVRRYI